MSLYEFRNLKIVMRRSQITDMLNYIGDRSMISDGNRFTRDRIVLTRDINNENTKRI